MIFHDLFFITGSRHWPGRHRGIQSSPDGTWSCQGGGGCLKYADVVHSSWWAPCRGQGYDQNKQKKYLKNNLACCQEEKITTVFCKTKVITRGIKSALVGWKNLSCKQKSWEGCSWFCTKIIGMELICCPRYVSCNMVEWIHYVVRWVFFTFFQGLGKVHDCFQFTPTCGPLL